jgi:hypothetical protein
VIARLLDTEESWSASSDQQLRKSIRFCAVLNILVPPRELHLLEDKGIEVA